MPQLLRRPRSAEIDLASTRSVAFPASSRVTVRPIPPGPLLPAPCATALLQNRRVETWVLVADYQVITGRDSVGPDRWRVLSLVAATDRRYIDPEFPIFNHSAVQCNQLMLPFLSLVASRNPTVESQHRHKRPRDDGPHAHLPGHPGPPTSCSARPTLWARTSLPRRRLSPSASTSVTAAPFPSVRVPAPGGLHVRGPAATGHGRPKMSKVLCNRHRELHMTADRTRRSEEARPDAERRITFDPAAARVSISSCWHPGYGRCARSDRGPYRRRRRGHPEALVTGSLNGLAPCAGAAPSSSPNGPRLHPSPAGGRRANEEQADQTPCHEVRTALQMNY